MSKFDVEIGATSVSIEIVARNAVTGVLMDSLLFNTQDLVCWWATPTQAAVQLPLVALAANGSWLSGGFGKKQNMAGTYRLDVPDSAFVAGNRTVHIQLRGAADMEAVDAEIAIVQKIQLGADDRVLVSSDAHTSGETVAAVAGHAAIVRSEVDASITLTEAAVTTDLPNLINTRMPTTHLNATNGVLDEVTTVTNGAGGGATVWTQAQIDKLMRHVDSIELVTFANGGTTSTAVIASLEGGNLPSLDALRGRALLVTSATPLYRTVLRIDSYDAATNTVTHSGAAVPLSSADTALLI